jgi:hypothetical protein
MKQKNKIKGLIGEKAEQILYKYELQIIRPIPLAKLRQW